MSVLFFVPGDQQVFQGCFELQYLPRLAATRFSRAVFLAMSQTMDVTAFWKL